MIITNNHSKFIYILVIIQHPWKTDEIRTESLLVGRFQKFSKGQTSGEAALTDHNEERKAFRVIAAVVYPPSTRFRRIRTLFSISETAAYSLVECACQYPQPMTSPRMPCSRRRLLSLPPKVTAHSGARPAFFTACSK